MSRRADLDSVVRTSVAALSDAEHEFRLAQARWQHARTVVGDCLRQARAELDDQAEAPNLRLAHDLYWNTQVRVEDIGHYLGVGTHAVARIVGPDGEQECPRCQGTMPARASRAGRPPLICSACVEPARAEDKMRAEAQHQQYLERLHEEERQLESARNWLGAQDGRPQSTVFEVPGTDGFWTLDAQGRPDRATVQRLSEWHAMWDEGPQ